MDKSIYANKMTGDKNKKFGRSAKTEYKKAQKLCFHIIFELSY